jgi:asparagine synthase (glutamine-hydrolysing)
MCGIAGIIATDPSAISVQRLKKMTDSIIHRGPEGEAFWIDQQVGFGHRRLCIIDLTEAAAQPMHYLERYTIVYNGEIYNYKELKEDLRKKGYQFHSASDTEVLLAAYACYGESCLRLLDGMFAFAIWDRQEQTLFAARDRFGEKPFYYHRDEKSGTFCFASEIKALFAAGVDLDYDGSRLLNYLAVGYTEHPVNHEHTFYKNIRSLPAAHYLMLRAGTAPATVRWWRLNTNQVAVSTDEAIDRFTTLFHESVRRRLRSDVPVGTSLSGGLDSSSVVATAAGFKNPLYSHKSFSAIFPGYIKDESYHIRLVSARYQLESHFTAPDAATLADDFSSFMHYHEQPISTASVYAQYKVYQAAKQEQVTVLLDGQGADEVLAGYSKYIHWYLQERWRSNANGISAEIKAFRNNDLPFTWSYRNLFAAWFPSLTAKELTSQAQKQLLRNPYINSDFISAHLDHSSFYKPEVRKLNDLLAFNTNSFGLGELLRYADSNSMAHSREVRLPFLQHELVELIFSLPTSFKMQQGWTKWVLRKSMEQVLPREIVWRKEKIGFEPPQENWMKDARIQELVSVSKVKLVNLGILKPSVADKKNQSPQDVTTDQDWRFLVAGTLLK